MAVPSFEALAKLLKHIDSALGGSLSAFEVMWQSFYRLVTIAAGAGQAAGPQDHPYYVLIESLGANPGSIPSASSPRWNRRWKQG